MPYILTFTLLLTGSFLVWISKGFKGKFDAEMVSKAERFSDKGNIRFFLGLGFWIIVLVIAGTLFRSEQTRTFRLKNPEQLLNK